MHRVGVGRQPGGGRARRGSAESAARVRVPPYGPARRGSSPAVQPVVALLGPRQCGKTTLARMYAQTLDNEPVSRFDLEGPTDLAALAEPKLALQDLVVIDEIQRAPDLFPPLRVLVDRVDNPGRFLILGSASRDLIRQPSETLAGRIGHIELTPLALAEAANPALPRKRRREASGQPRNAGPRVDSPAQPKKADKRRPLRHPPYYVAAFALPVSPKASEATPPSIQLASKPRSQSRKVALALRRPPSQ
jgi:energy-coupling factor transporter ATP-binding protein EcfA2